MNIVLYGGAPDPFMPQPSPREPDFWPQPTTNRLLPLVNPPPSYAADDETAAIAAIAKLDDAARARVLRYLTSRYGEHKP